MCDLQLGVPCICLMDNHYHLIIETPDAHLSKGMRQLSGVFTQKFNYMNRRVGHCFQGRYKAIHIEKDSYLLELARYVVLNPGRAEFRFKINESFRGSGAQRIYICIYFERNMSYELSGEDVVLAQRLLSCEGLYKGELNGEWTAATDRAKQEFYRRSQKIKAELGEFDERTEKCIETLLLKTQIEARLFMNRIKGSGKIVKIISGTRTYEEQRKIYNQGRRGRPGRKVSYARAGQSTHNFGIAWDIGIFSTSGAYSKSERSYKAIGKLGRSSEIGWGGDWERPDLPHYQLALPNDLSKREALAKFEMGEPIFV